MILQIILYFFSGAISGFMAGLLGIGGGAIIVPALVYIFTHTQHVPDSLLMHMASGTTLAIMVFTALSAVRVHHVKGRILWDIYKKLMIGVIIGVIGGAFLSDILNTQILKICFGVFLLIIAFRMLFSSSLKTERKFPSKLITNLVSLIIGIKSGLLGIGGGALTVPFLMRYNIPLRNVVAISALVSLTVSITGSIMFMFNGFNEPNLPPMSIGFIYLPAVLGVTISSVIFVPLGARLAYIVPVKTLKTIFATFLLLVGVHMLWF